MDEEFAFEARIKEGLLVHLKELGFIKNGDGLFSPPNTDKETFRLLHRIQRLNKIKIESHFIAKSVPKLLGYFASGTDIDPCRIKPKLQLVQSQTIESDLFRLATLTWSIPVSNGYGRRMRFLVWDENNNKLIGIIALGDPVFNLKVRDDLIGWDSKERQERLVNMMDAYILGAVPPYNMLLSGKMIACLIKTREVVNIFKKRYSGKNGIISGKKKNPTLVAVTTSSALGKSSVYNRLKINGAQYFKSIGYTAGWGHFHIPNDLFSDMREYLRIKNHKYYNNYRFGSGPNWRLRTTRAVLDLIGINSDILKHGIYREVYLCKLADNAEDVLKGISKKPDYKNLLSVREVADIALDRWVIPRSQRLDNYHNWNNNYILDLLNPATDYSHLMQQINGKTDSNFIKDKK